MDQLRQNLMCHGDVSPTKFEWDEKNQMLLPRLSTRQTCRNFDRIRSWAFDRKIPKFNVSEHVVDGRIVGGAQLGKQVPKPHHAPGTDLQVDGQSDGH